MSGKYRLASDILQVNGTFFSESVEIEPVEVCRSGAKAARLDLLSKPFTASYRPEASSLTQGSVNSNQRTLDWTECI